MTQATQTPAADAARAALAAVLAAKEALRLAVEQADEAAQAAIEEAEEAGALNDADLWREVQEGAENATAAFWGTGGLDDGLLFADLDGQAPCEG